MRKKTENIPAINKRLKDIRTALKLSQRAFAERLGYTSGTIGAIEIGITPVEKRIAVAICAVYGVNSTWFETGDGEMFVQKGAEPQKSARELAEQYLVEKFRSLSPELREDVVAFCNAILAEDTRALKKRFDACINETGQGDSSGT